MATKLTNENRAKLALKQAVISFVLAFPVWFIVFAAFYAVRGFARVYFFPEGRDVRWYD